jgi:hypothetical protein
VRDEPPPPPGLVDQNVVDVADVLTTQRPHHRHLRGRERPPIGMPDPQPGRPLPRGQPRVGIVVERTLQRAVEQHEPALGVTGGHPGVQAVQQCLQERLVLLCPQGGRGDLTVRLGQPFGVQLGGDLGRGDGGEFLEQQQFVELPLPWLRVAGTERSQQGPVRPRQRISGIGDQPQVRDRQTAAQQGMQPGVRHHQGRTGIQDEPAERMRQRSVTDRRPRLRQPAGTQEPLPMGFEYGGQRDRHVQQACRHGGQPVQARRPAAGGRTA